jgi:hypothetical protein
MNSTHRLSVIAGALVFSFSLARGQEVPDPSVLVGKIANWPAPDTWSPQSVSQGISTMGVVTSPLPFIGLSPCRIVDTRQAGFPAGYGTPALTAGVPRNFTLTGKCGIPSPVALSPSSAAAVSLNVTVTNTQGPGHILIFPQGAVQPDVSTLNYVGGQTIANAAVVSLGTDGGITVIAGVSGTDLIIDTNGYYAPAGVGTGNTFLGQNAGNFTMTVGLNTGLGYNALSSNTTGGGNTATGALALLFNTVGIRNTATGESALSNNTEGFENTANGALALLFNTTGSNNIGIGTFSGSNLTTGDNNICIGNPGVAAESSRIRIGSLGQLSQVFPSW